MTALHTYSYIVVDTQRGCHTLKKGKTEVLEKKPVPVSHFPLQISHGLAPDRSQDFAVSYLQLITLGMVRP